MSEPGRQRPFRWLSPATFLVLLGSCVDGHSDAGDEDDETGGDPVCQVAEQPALTADAGRRQFGLVARAEDLPGIATQASDHGKEIGTLWTHLGRVHLGYGDYNDNTGPLEMVSYVPADAAFEMHGEVSTEEIQRFVAYDGALFTANIDPRGHQYDGSIFRLDFPCGQWQAGAPIDGAAHTYALLEFEDRIWVGTGSLGGAPARVMSTGDGGETWREEFAVESAADSFTRILDGAALDDQLLFTGRSFPTDGDTNFTWQRLDGEWSPVFGGPDVARVVPVAFAGQLAVLAFSSDVGKGGKFAGGYALEGDELIPHAWFPAGFELVNWSVAPPNVDSDPWFWALGKQQGESVVIISADLAAWEPLAGLEALDRGELRSIAYEANDLFLGSSAGDLHVLAEVFAPGSGLDTGGGETARTEVPSR